MAKKLTSERANGAVSAHKNSTALPEHQALVVYPGAIKGRPTIELRVLRDGKNEAFLVPFGGQPVATGISLVRRNAKYFIYCRIRKKYVAFKPEEVVRQKVLNWLLDEMDYDEVSCFPWNWNVRLFGLA